MNVGTTTESTTMASNETNDKPEPSDTSVAPEDDRAKASSSPALPKMSRRKLTYVAPALVSRAMFYGAAGCGKGDPRIFACQALRRGSS